MTRCRGALPLLVSVLALALAAPAAAQLAGKEVKIGIGGPLTTTSAGFGVEMKQAVDLALDERNAAGGIAGAKVLAVAVDDKADPEAGKVVAKGFCDDPAILGVVGHVNSGVAIATGQIYADCSLAVITPMASNPKVTESGFATIFRLTNRDDRKGPGLAYYLIEKMGKKRALVVDDGTPYGIGLADQFVAGFGSGGTVVARKSVKVGEKDFADFVKSWPKDFDVVFFAGIREGALILKEMRRRTDATVHLRGRLLGHQGIHSGIRRRRHESGRCPHSIRRARDRDRSRQRRVRREIHGEVRADQQLCGKLLRFGARADGCDR